MTELERMREENDGTLPAFAWPGGYPICYYASDGGIFCPDCANGKNGSECRLSDGPDDCQDGWLVAFSDIHWEGPPEICCHCGAEIESAYGDPDAEESEAS